MLATASHYWPLDSVEGIHGLLDQIGNRTGHVNGTNISMSHLLCLSVFLSFFLSFYITTAV